MAAQTKYGYATPSGVPGGLFDLAPYEVNTRTNEETPGALKFGHGVVVGTSAGNGIKLPAAATDVFEGVVVHKAHELDASNAVSIAKGEALSIIRTGKVWVRVDGDVAVNDKVYLSFAEGKVGLFTKTATGNIAINARFIGASEDGIAPIVLYNADPVVA